jgi:hypothetical protein
MEDKKLTDGIIGLIKSRKGMTYLISLFSILIPSTILCAMGKVDGISYSATIGAVATLLTAIYCHTHSSQINGNRNG